jgi:streptogramin lyase
VLVACGIAGLVLASLVGLTGHSASAQPASVAEFPAGQAPTNIVAGPDGNLWFRELFRNGISRFTVAGEVTPFTDVVEVPPPEA